MDALSARAACQLDQLAKIGVTRARISRKLVETPNKTNYAAVRKRVLASSRRASRSRTRRIRAWNRRTTAAFGGREIFRRVYRFGLWHCQLRGQDGFFLGLGVGRFAPALQRSQFCAAFFDGALDVVGEREVRRNSLRLHRRNRPPGC